MRRLREADAAAPIRGQAYTRAALHRRGTVLAYQSLNSELAHVLSAGSITAPKLGFQPTDEPEHQKVEAWASRIIFGRRLT